MTKISMFMECCIYLALGFFAYLVFGDNFTPMLFILRRPYEGKNFYSEKAFQILISCFLLINSLGLGIYNAPLRDCIGNYYDVHKTKMRYFFISLLPIFVSCVISAFFPNVIGVLSLFGFTVYNFDGYIIPILMAIACFKYKSPNFFKRLFIFLLLLFFCGLGLFCIFLEIKKLLIS